MSVVLAYLDVAHHQTVDEGCCGARPTNETATVGGAASGCELTSEDAVLERDRIVGNAQNTSVGGIALHAALDGDSAQHVLNDCTGLPDVRSHTGCILAVAGDGTVNPEVLHGTHQALEGSTVFRTVGLHTLDSELVALAIKHSVEIVIVDTDGHIVVREVDVGGQACIACIVDSIDESGIPIELLGIGNLIGTVNHLECVYIKMSADGANALIVGVGRNHHRLVGVCLILAQGSAIATETIGAAQIDLLVTLTDNRKSILSQTLGEDNLLLVAIEQIAQTAAGNVLLGDDGAAIVAIVLIAVDGGGIAADKSVVSVHTADSGNTVAVGECATGCPAGDGSRLVGTRDGTRHIAVADFEGALALHVHTDDTSHVLCRTRHSTLVAQTVHYDGTTVDTAADDTHEGLTREGAGGIEHQIPHL